MRKLGRLCRQDEPSRKVCARRPLRAGPVPEEPVGTRLVWMTPPSSARNDRHRAQAQFSAHGLPTKGTHDGHI
jgi:hypothetical protein